MGEEVNKELLSSLGKYKTFGARNNANVLGTLRAQGHQTASLDLIESTDLKFQPLWINVFVLYRLSLDKFYSASNK